MGSLVVMYGSQTFRSSSAKIHTFVMVGDGSNRRNFPDTALNAMHLPPSSTKVMAANTGSDEYGAWFSKKYESKDGVVMALQARTTRNGLRYNDGIVFVALRDTGPLLSIQVNLCPDRKAMLESISVFQGRGDVLSFGELSDYGIELYPSYVNTHMNPEELEELFDIRTLTPGGEKPVTVEVTKGGRKTRVHVVPVKSRRIRIRGK